MAKMIYLAKVDVDGTLRSECVPVKAFSTLKAAQRHLDELKDRKWGYTYCIQEIELVPDVEVLDESDGDHD